LPEPDLQKLPDLPKLSTDMLVVHVHEFYN